MNIEGLIKKIQFLINKRSIGVSNDENRDTYQIIHFRDSFRHKYSSIILHFNMIKDIKSKVNQIIEKDIHGNHDFLVGDNKKREKIAFVDEINFKCTVFLEDILYHLTSIFDNLPKIISVYYKTVKSKMKFRSAKGQLNHEHTKDLEITKLINDNWGWINEIKDFRAQIFHHHSKICKASMITNFTRNDDGSTSFDERIVLNVPEKLKKAIKYEKDDAEIEDFNKVLIDKSFEFFDKLFDILIKEHEIYLNNKDK